MSSRRRHRSSDKARRGTRKMLHLMQCIVAHSDTNDTALHLEWQHEMDVAVVQESWAETRAARLGKLAKIHPRYDVFFPIEDWAERKPRVITYVHKDPKLQTSQLRPFVSPDMCVIRVNNVTICNVYVQLGGDYHILTNLEGWQQPVGTVIAGDFNAVHWLWRSNHKRHKGPGERVAKWAEDHGLAVLNLEAPTHQGGNVVDPTLSDIASADAWVNPILYARVDHYAIEASIPVAAPPVPNPGKYRIPIDEWYELAQLIRQNAPTFEEPQDPEDLNRMAD
ncbi:hypothetical protein DL770_010922 [Monosporascus sp. CRB-9-2]|nr:hypothetical protein DL770_010922 [Monosporascus sp. CRB-9-2]